MGATLDTLSIQFNANGADKAVQNITMMAQAVRRLADSLKPLESSKLGEFAQGMAQIKENAPSSAEAKNMTAFADAIVQLTNAINGANITTFANDMGTMGDAVQSFRRSSVNGITNAVTAMTQLGQQAQSTASTVQSATAKLSQQPSMQSSPVTSSSVNEVVAALDRVASRTDLIKRKFHGLVMPTKAFKSLEEQANRVADKYDKLRDKIQEALNSGNLTVGTSAYEERMAELDALRNKYDELILKQKELAIEGGAIQLNPAVVSTLNAFKSGFTQVTDIVKNGLHAALQGVNSQFKSFVGHVKSAASALKKTVTGGNNVTNMAKSLSKELLRVSKMLKLMVTRMALRAVIKEVGNGFKSLALHCETFNNSMSQIINGSKKLGYSFAAMIEPIINALAPALIYLINLITQVINALNQLFTALGGGTVWHRAKNFTDNWADSIKAGNKQAKELKKTVLGFDELNQLQDNKNSGGGGGNNITDMFEDVQIDPKWKDFAQWLKDMWKTGDFTELGKLWGEKLRDVLESIPWDEIRQTSNKLGKSLATLINGFVEVERLGFDIGYTIAQAVNTVFEFVNGFVHNLHWDSIGKFIADVFNGFFETIDWKLIKDTVVTGMAGIAEAIQNFIDEFHWDNISNFIINAVDTIASGIRAFFEGINWGDLGAKIGDQLMKTIKGIDWKEVGHALADIFQAAIDFFGGLLDQLKVEDVIQAASDLVASFFENVDMEKAGENIGKILQFLIDFIKGFWKENGDTIKTEIGNFFKGIWDEVDKEDIAKIGGVIIGAAFLNGLIKAASYAVTQFVSQKIMSTMLTSALTKAGVVGGEGLVTGVSTGVETSVASGGLAGALAMLKAAILPVAATVAIGYGIAIPASKKLEEILGETQKKVDDLKGNMDNTIPSYDEMSRAAREASRNQREYAEKMQEMYDAILAAHPELASLAQAMDENKIKGSKNVDVLVQLNDGLKIFRENGGSASETLAELEEMYGKVDKKTEKFFESLGTGETKTTNVKAAMDDFNATLREAETRSETATHVYKNHTEVIAEMKKAQEETIGVYKTHLDVIKENTEKTADLKNAVGETAKAMPQLDSALKDAQKAMQDASSEAEETGENIVQGIKEPIINAKFDDESKSLFDRMCESLKNVFGIASPAKNMYPIGNDILLGIDEGFKEKFDDFSKTFTDFYDNIVKPWFDKSKWTFEGVGEGLKKTFEGAKDAIKNVWNGIADKVNGEHEIGDTKIRINLPKFARGGFPEDGLFMANHHELVGEFSNGRTAVANNAQIVAGIESGVYKAVSQAMANNSSSNSYIANEIIVDGDVIARTITKAQEKTNRRYSPLTV